ncbi:hypothetical protein Poli38472_012771 [Pythium oligandrum]|uniref:Diphosphomevalonate decarboxylase n=1 Tax=Pythium oligandrum TaxID=41045 RepID=A0A8K1CEZ2_PYTOL|nr:hypothetical protein Poli38472_012771 [Pythium oligandrum]|eukprot:TMW61580.1 hypothetical protein Poli38472_012771 [Pythium oligandrum]
MTALRVATCSAPTNIATIKYWGKDSTALNTPLNSSVSVTLHQDDLRTKTTIAASPAFATTHLWLNGKEQSINARVQAVLREMKALAHKQHGEQALHSWHLRIVSENSFPTAAGLASSAAGYACLVATLAELYKVKDESPGQLSSIARQGSGSACRSLDGGFVRWQKGVNADGSDSLAVRVADEHHWPALRAIICVVNDREKDTSSTSGMKTSKETSTLLQHRVASVVDGRLEQIEAAYQARDFATFGELTMRDSNQFHAVCLDTYPPIFYMNEVSRKIIHIVHRFNTFHGAVRAAYTFDAGPNAVIFLEDKDVAAVLALLQTYFPTTRDGGSLPIQTVSSASELHQWRNASFPADLRAMTQVSPSPGGIKSLYVTRVGGGTRVLATNESLVDLTTGKPRIPRVEKTKEEPAPSPSRGPLAVLTALVGMFTLLSVARR